MNRRQFFKLAGGTAAAAAALAALPDLGRKIFLPPRGGWLPNYLRMRELELYDVANDMMWIRHDYAFRDPHGREFQYGVDQRLPIAPTQQDWEMARDMSRSLIKKAVNRKCGLSYARPPRYFKQELPRTLAIARWV